MRFFQGLERAGRETASSLLGHWLQVKKGTLPDIQQSFDRGEIRKILLVRNYQGMGDLLCATPVIASLKARFPKASIHFLANTFNSAVLKNNPHLDRVWTWDENHKADPRQWISLRRSLQQEQFDLALVLSGNALSLTAILWAALSGARWVLGYETHAYGQSWGPRLYSFEIPWKPAVREIDKYIGLVEGLGIACTNRAPEFFVRPEHTAYAKDQWSSLCSALKAPFVGIFLGGKTDRPDRIWSPENYARVARRLKDDYGCSIVAIAPPLSGSQNQQIRESTFWSDEAVHEKGFRQTFGEDLPLFRNADLGRVGALLQKLDLFICPDGGMMHIAAALHVPTLTLFFGTPPEIWHPPVSTSDYLSAPGKVPASLSVETVVQKAVAMLKVPV